MEPPPYESISTKKVSDFWLKYVHNIYTKILFTDRADQTKKQQQLNSRQGILGIPAPAINYLPYAFITFSNSQTEEETTERLRLQVGWLVSNLLCVKLMTVPVTTGILLKSLSICVYFPMQIFRR